MPYSLLLILDNGIEVYILNASEDVGFHKGVIFLKLSYKLFGLEAL